MRSKSEGLTKTYNRFHDQQCFDGDIQRLRELQIQLDCAVLESHQWSDIDPGHGFHSTKQGVRFTISENARRKVLDRLLALNHQRHAEEKAEEMLLGKQPKATGKRGRKAKVEAPHDGVTLFSEVGD